MQYMAGDGHDIGCWIANRVRPDPQHAQKHLLLQIGHIRRVIAQARAQVTTQPPPVLRRDLVDDRLSLLALHRCIRASGEEKGIKAAAPTATSLWNQSLTPKSTTGVHPSERRKRQTAK